MSKYALEVVKGDRVIPISESNNHSSQMIREAESERLLGSHSLGHPGNELWVAEYSPSQKVFHRSLIKQSCSMNLKMILNKTFNDWLVVGFGSMEQCGHIITKLKEAFNEAELL